jgi:hypothetical protein
MERQQSWAALRALERRIDDGADATQIAAFIVADWQQIELILRPIVGARGVAALYQRSLFVSGKEYEWLTPCYRGIQAAIDLPLLKTALALQQRDIAVQGGTALFTTFHELLSSLVGEALTTRLLFSVWDSSLRGPTAQDGSQ